MDFKTKTDLLRQNWPSGKNRVLSLDYGCKTAVEAMARKKNQPYVEIPIPELTPEEIEQNRYDLTKAAIAEVLKAFDGKDSDKLKPKVLERLNALPIENLEQLKKWKEAWLWASKNGFDNPGKSDITEPEIIIDLT